MFTSKGGIFMASKTNSFFQPIDWGLAIEHFSFIWEDKATFQKDYLNIKVKPLKESEKVIVREDKENLNPIEYLKQLIAFATAAEHIYNWDFVDSDDGIKADESLETFVDIGLSVLTVVPSIGAALSIAQVGSLNPKIKVAEAIKQAMQFPSSTNKEIPQEVIKLVSRGLAKIAKKLINKEALIKTDTEEKRSIINLLNTIATGKELTWKTIFEEMILTAPENILGPNIAKTRQELLGELAKIPTASIDNIPSNFKDISASVVRNNSLLEPLKKVISKLFNGALLDPQKVTELLHLGATGKSQVSVLYRVFDEVVSKASQGLIKTRLGLESIVSTFAEHASYQGVLQKMQVSLDELEIISSALKSEIAILDQMEDFAADLLTYYEVSDNKEEFIRERNLLHKQKLSLKEKIEAINNFWTSDTTFTKRKRKREDLKAELAAVEKKSQAVRDELQIHSNIASQLDTFEATVKTYLQEIASQASYHWLANSVKEVLGKGTVREALSELSTLRSRLGVTLELTKKQCQSVREQRGNYLAAQLLNKAVDTALKQIPVNEKAPRKVDNIEFDTQLGQAFADYFKGVQLFSDANNGEIDNAAEKYRQVQEKLVMQIEEGSLEKAEKLTTAQRAILSGKDVRGIAQKVASKHITNQKLHREKLIYQRGYQKLLRAKAKADDVLLKIRQVLGNSEALKNLGLQKYQYQIAALEKSIDYGIKLIAAAKASLHNQQDQHFLGRIKRIFPLARDSWGNTNSFILQQLQEEINELEKHKKEVDKTIEKAAPYSEQRLANMQRAADEAWSKARDKSNPRKRKMNYRAYEERLELANRAKHFKQTELGEIPLRLEKLKGLKDSLSNISLANLIEQLENSVDNWLLGYSQVKQEYVSILESNAEKELLGVKNRQILTNEALNTCKQRLEPIMNLGNSKLFDKDEFNVLDTVYKGFFLEEEIISLESAVTNDQERLHFLRNYDARVTGYPVEQRSLSKDIAKTEAKLSKTLDELSNFREERILEPVLKEDIPNGNLLTELRELYAVLRKPKFMSQAANLARNNLKDIKEDLGKLAAELSLEQKRLVEHNGKLSQSIPKIEKSLINAQIVVERFQEVLNVYHQVYLPVANSESLATVFANLLRNKFENQDPKEVQVRYQPRAVVEHALRQLIDGKRDKSAGLILKGYLEGFTGYRGVGYKGFESYQGLKAAILNYIFDPWLEETRVDVLSSEIYKDEGNIDGGFQNTLHQLFSYGEPVDAEKISAGLGATLLKLFGDAEYFTVQRIPNQNHPYVKQINEIDKQLNEIVEGEFWKESFGAKLSSDQIADGAESIATLTRVINISDLAGDNIKLSFDWFVKGERTSKALTLKVRNSVTGSHIHTEYLRSKGTNEWQNYEEFLGNARVFRGFDEEEVEQLEIFFEIKAGYTGYLDNLVLSGTTKVTKSLERLKLQQKRENLLASSNEQSWYIQYNAALNDEERKWVTQLFADVGFQEGSNPVKDLVPNGVLNILDPELFYLDNLPYRISDDRTAKAKYASIIAAIEKASGEFGLAYQAESMLIKMGKTEDKNKTDYSDFWHWLKALNPVEDLNEEFYKAKMDFAAVLDDFSIQFQPLFEAISRKQGKVAFELSHNHDLVL